MLEIRWWLFWLIQLFLLGIFQKLVFQLGNIEKPQFQSAMVERHITFSKYAAMCSEHAHHLQRLVVILSWILWGFEVLDFYVSLHLEHSDRNFALVQCNIPFSIIHSLLEVVYAMVTWLWA